jgi:hypothetical protein
MMRPIPGDTNAMFKVLILTDGNSIQLWVVATRPNQPSGRATVPLSFITSSK